MHYWWGGNRDFLHRSVSPSRKEPTRGLEVQLFRYTSLFTDQISTPPHESTLQAVGAAGSRIGSCTPHERNQCSRTHRKERSPSTPRRSRPSAGPKTLRPPVSPSFSLRPRRTPSALFPRPPRGALTRLSCLLQPPPLLTQTLSAPGVRDPSLSTPPIGRCPYPW